MLSKHEEQAERREIIENEKRLREQGTTFSQFAQSEAAEARGRFSSISNPAVIGSTPLPAAQYPQGPAWCAADQEIEPPLGYAIDELASLEPTPAQAPPRRSSLISSSVQETPSAQEAPTSADGSHRTTPLAKGAEGSFSRTAFRRA